MAIGTSAIVIVNPGEEAHAMDDLIGKIKNL